jgi:photosystem II stability/assembly factor-like uncharacterized protein
MGNRWSKILYLLPLLLFQANAFTQGTWEKIAVPTNHLLNSVFFSDSLNGWAAGDTGTIIHTVDGGKNWTLQDSHTKNEITAIFFLNEDIGWAASLNYSTVPYGTLMLKTTDGGASWSGEPYPDESVFITCILFTDSLHGWMGGMPHALVKTNNGGITWTQAAVDTSNLAFFPVLGIQFYDDRYGYACGGMHDIAGVVWRTSDGGEKWYAMDAVFAPADEIHALHLFDSLNVMGAGGDPDFGYGAGIIRTADGGLNWNYQELGLQGNLFDLDFRTGTEAWAPMGPQRKFIYSLDAGSAWTQIPTPDSTVIFDVMFPDSLHGCAVGANGAVLKYKPAYQPSVGPGLSLLADEFCLFQNYPNPCAEDTRIKFRIPPAESYMKLVDNRSSVSVKVVVFDLLGRAVTTFINTDMSPGIHEIAFNAACLPGGTYYYRLQVCIPGQTINCGPPRKMILLK